MEKKFACEDFLQISEIYGFVQISGIFRVLFKFQEKKLYIHNFKLIGLFCF
jgi:hypothetical protein